MTDIDVPLGQLTPGDPPVLEFVRTLRHPVEKVWSAITERQHLHSWLPCDIIGERREGASLQLPFWPEVTAKYGFDDPGLTGMVRVWEPPRVFEWSWDTDIVRFELTDQGPDTILRLRTWVSDQSAGVVKTGAGYHVCLEHLRRLLDTGAAPPVTASDPTTLEAAYASAFGLPVEQPPPEGDG
jgi:uncharacterized protein YndB with AHSA1/START domain